MERMLWCRRPDLNCDALDYELEELLVAATDLNDLAPRKQAQNESNGCTSVILERVHRKLLHVLLMPARTLRPQPDTGSD